MPRTTRRRRDERVQEPPRMPKTSIQYKKLQESSFVTAAAVARFTDPLSNQLVVFKEAAMEVWEVEEQQQRKVISGVLEKPVSHCCVLETSKLIVRDSTPLHLDVLLVTDGSGGLMVCEWNESLSVVQESGRVTVHLSPEQPSAVLLSTPLFSCPLYLPNKLSWKRPLSLNETEHGTTSKVEGLALVAMSLYQGMLGILCVEWISTYPTLLKECGVWPIKPSLTPRLNLHFFPLPTENSIPGPTVAIANPCVVRDLAFIGANEGAGYGALDLKGRPLLVLLSSQQGFIYHSLRLQCMVLDISTFQLQPGPWEIRNLNPSTSLLLPWSFAGNLGDVVGIKSGIQETGLRHGSGVLAMSCAGMMFVEAGGRRASLPLHLDGLPTCWIRLPQNRLVLGDEAGGLHILGLSNWEPNIISKIVLSNLLPPVRILLHVTRKQHFEDTIIFASGQGGNSQLFKLIRTPVESSEGFPVEYGEKWFGNDMATGSSAFLDSLTPVRDVILVKEAIRSPDPFLLLACGSSPASTLRKGSLTGTFHVDKIMEADKRGLPQLLPFHEFWGSEFHTHILVSYPIANVSEVWTTTGTKTEDQFMRGLERRRCTLALSALPGGWFIQITETSLRVLGNDSSSRDLRAEWKLPFSPPNSPRNLKGSEKIHHAALTRDGALLVSGSVVHSVEIDCFGLPHTIASSDRPHQVSALGFSHVGDSCLHTIARELVVVIAQWISNSVHLLSWPNLEEMVTMDACTAPVLSVALGRLALIDYLFAGTADGNLVYYKLTGLKRSSSGVRNDEAASMENLPSAVDEEEGESKRMLRKIRNLGSVPTNPQTNKSTMESEKVKVPQYTLRQGRIIKVGTIITHMEFGCFNGGGDGGTSNRSENSSSENDEECLYIWSERSLVLLPQHLQDIHAVVLHCQTLSVPQLTKLHTEEHPHSLVGALKDGKLLCGHLDLSIKLRWQTLKVEGTAMHVAYYKSSGCIAFTSIDGVSSNLHIVHEETMQQLLVVELEWNHSPKVLTTLQLPSTMCSQNAESVDCLVIATQKMDEQKSSGFLFFLDIQVDYASEIPGEETKYKFCKDQSNVGKRSKLGEKEVKYELRMLGSHSLDQPCHSICMVDTLSKSFTPSPCTMCSLEYFPRDDPWLLEILQCLESAGKHWSHCCSDRSSDPVAPQTGSNIPRGSLLALGFQGKVELLYAFIGDFEACMLVVPSVAAALDAPFLPSPGVHEDLDRQHENIEDVSETVPSATETAADGSLGVQWMPSRHPGLASTWSTSSRINIQNLACFVTPGGGCVTTLIPMARGTMLVVEKLHGLSVFEIAAESFEVVQLAWQPCPYPLEAVIPLSDDSYLLSMHGNGCVVTERDYPAEAACQIQEKLRRDLETELMSMQDQVQDETPRSVILLELQRSSMERLPCLKQVAAASWTSTGCSLASGALSLESMPLTRTLTKSKLAQRIAAVSATGEVGMITILLSSPSSCSSGDSQSNTHMHTL